MVIFEKEFFIHSGQKILTKLKKVSSTSILELFMNQSELDIFPSMYYYNTDLESTLFRTGNRVLNPKVPV